MNGDGDRALAASVDSTAYDPTRFQIESLLGVGAELSQSNLCTPEAVALLLYQHKVTLSQLQKAESDVAVHRKHVDELRDQREDLKVDIARLETKRTVTLVDIPVSVISGFAINLVLTDGSRAIGIALLIVSLVILLMIRGGDVKNCLQSFRKGTENSNV